MNRKVEEKRVRVNGNTWRIKRTGACYNETSGGSYDVLTGEINSTNKETAQALGEYYVMFFGTYSNVSDLLIEDNRLRANAKYGKKTKFDVNINGDVWSITTDGKCYSSKTTYDVITGKLKGEPITTEIKHVLFRYVNGGTNNE